jgi:hypothetical protein
MRRFLSLWQRFRPSPDRDPALYYRMPARLLADIGVVEPSTSAEAPRGHLQERSPILPGAILRT